MFGLAEQLRAIDTPANGETAGDCERERVLTPYLSRRKRPRVAYTS